MNELTRAKILEAVLSERERQDNRWGDQTHNTDLQWMSILTEEIGEVAKDVNDQRIAGMFEELIQCAAVCFAWSEAYINRGELKDDSE
jgi:NTP pyrophosphatase (non-canonical NTP hydrolase)